MQLFINGAPGSGKSWLAHRTAIELALSKQLTKLTEITEYTPESLAKAEGSDIVIFDAISDKSHHAAALEWMGKQNPKPVAVFVTSLPAKISLL